jgi:hypothetical protein
MSEYATVPSGRNVAHNPRPTSLTHMAVVGGTQSLTTEASFSGNQSVRVVLGASQSWSWKAAVDDDADLAAIPAESSVFIAARVAGSAVGNWQAIGRVWYTDGTTTAAALSGLGITLIPNSFQRLDWSRVVGAGKTVRNVGIEFTTGAGVSLDVLVGGLDIRVNQPVDSFIHGDAGDGYSWEGTANNSPSVRESFVAAPVFGTGGQYSPTLTVEIISRHTGGVLGDITDHVLGGSITYDLDTDEHKGTCSLTLDDPGIVEVLGDEWIRFHLRIDRTDGSVEEGPLGVFILDPPKERWTEGADEWVYPGRDITSLLSTTFIRGVPQELIFTDGETETVLRAAYFAKEGTSYRAIIQDVLLNDAGLRSGQFLFSADLPQFLDSDMGWEEQATVMEIVTDTLEGAGWQKPWMAPAGFITSAPAGVNPATVSPSLYLSTGNNSRVRWPFEVDADAGGIGNRVRVISAKDVTSVTTRKKKRKGKRKNVTSKVTKRHAVEVWRMNNDPTHPLSYPRLGRWIDIPDVKQPLVQNDAEANALADQALIEAGQLPLRVRLTTEAMVRGLNEVYELNLRDHWGEPIDSGQGRYWCRGWSIQLGPPWEMVHNLSRTIDFRAASFVSE